MGRIVDLVGRIVVGVVVSLLAGELPHVGRREPGLQPPRVTIDLEHPHGDEPVLLMERGPRVEQPPPPPVVPVPAPWFPPSRYLLDRPYRRHPSYYMNQPDGETPAIAYAAEQAKQTPSVA